MTTQLLSYRPQGGDVRADLDRLVASRMLVQANSGGGKSRALRQLLEETHGRVQHLVLDPEGEFSTLRERFDYVLAGKEGDVPATPKTARLLCRRLVELGTSAVIDLYDLSLHERREFVKLFLLELMALPRALWHPALVVIDEAHLFAPQSGESQSTEAVIALCTQGRKRGFSAILATQRISKLHKDAAAELLNKLIGRTGLDVDMKRAGDELGLDKDARRELARLAAGEFYVYGPAIANEIQLVRTGDVITSHPEAGTLGAAPPPPSSKVKTLLAQQLADLPKEAEEEARTIVDLQRQLREANARAKRAEKQGVERVVEKIVGDPRAVEQAVKAASRQHAATITTLRKALEAAMKFIVTVNTQSFDVAGVDKTELERAITAAVDRATLTIDKTLESRARQIDALRLSAQRIAAQLKAVLGNEEIVVEVAVAKNEPFTVSTAAKRALAPSRAARPAASNGNGNGTLPKGERIVLTAIAQHADGVERDQLSILSGYKRSTRDAYVQRLQTSGYVELVGSTIIATDAGVDALGSDYEPLPTGEALLEYWLDRLPEGERKVLAVLAEAFPDAVGRDEISRGTGYKRSTRDAYIQRLGSRKLIETVGSAVRARALLFEEVN